jgi:hypothetical protein
MRPDCLFLDSNGEIMCIVEVNVTHAKDEKDIEKIEQYKIRTIELTYGKSKDNYQQPVRTEWLYQSEIPTQIRDCHRRIKIGEDEIQRLRTEEQRKLSNFQDTEIRGFEKTYNELDIRIGKLQRDNRELEREIREEEALNTAFNKYIARLQSENYKKRLENEQTKQTETT